MTTTDVDAIVRGLTEAQKRALTWPAKSTPIMIWYYPVTMVVLERHGLIADRRGGWATLSPLGLAIRHRLEGACDE